MRIHSETAWDIAYKFAPVLHSETRDLAALIDVALKDLRRSLELEQAAHATCAKLRAEAEDLALRLAEENAALREQDAAAEIERLNAEVLKWQVEAGKFGPGMEAMEDLLADEKAKNARLRTRNAALVESLRSHKCQVDNRATVGECQQCGCSDGILIQPLAEQIGDK